MRALALAIVVMLASLIAARAEARSVRAASIQSVICGVFGPYCSQALRVAWCESRFETTASNGQYLGLFQMGSLARAKYGYGSDPWTQSESAFRYFADSNFRWGPWTCQP